MRMWQLSDLFDVDSDHCLLLKKGVIRGEVRKWIDDYATNGTYITFDSEKYFFAWMGNPDAKADRQTALDEDTERGDVDAAVAITKIMGSSATDLRKFKQKRFNKKTLEYSIKNKLPVYEKFEQ